MAMYSPYIPVTRELTRVQSPPEKPTSSHSHLSPTSKSTGDSSTVPPFLPRSKSDLTMSSLPNLTEVPTSSSELSLAPSTRSASVAQVRDEKPAGLARSLFSRSSRLLHKRRSNSKLRSGDSQIDGEEMPIRGTHDIGSRKRSKHGRLDSYESRWKPSISEPYNFQHLTHTGPSQAKTLRTAPHQDLITEFSAIRTSQAPQAGLKGIKADDLQAAFSPESSSFASPITSFDSPIESGPTSPFASPIGIDEGRSLRTSKSIDSFTRVSSKSFSSPKPPVSPPPRRSSRQLVGTQPVPFGLSTTVMESPTVPSVMTPTSNNSSPSSYFNMNSSILSPPSNDSATEAPKVDTGEIAQAVTTPDDSAYLLINNPHSGSSATLADVPEEEEDGSKHISKGTTHKLRHARSFPSTRSLVKPATGGLPWSTPQPDNEEWAAAVDATPLPYQQRERVDNKPERAYRTSGFFTTSRSSWEDDIDYCYEHAMEADGSEWDASSTEDTFWMHDDTTKSSTPTPALHQLQQSEASPTRDSCLHSIPPEHEETNSASSSSVSVPGVITPCDPAASLQLPGRYSTASRSNPALYPLSPSLLIPKEYSSRVTHEESYAQNFPEVDATKQALSAFPYYSQDLRVDVDLPREYNSARSSGSPISKQTSRESLATGKSSAATSRHRRSSSVGSLPELVPSSAMATSSNLLPTQRSDVPHPRNPELIPPPLSLKNLRANSTAFVPAPTSAPPAPTSFASRARTFSDATRALPDLALIGAPKPPSRLRAGSAAAASVTVRPKGHRTSYSLFPQGSMSSLREMPQRN